MRSIEYIYILTEAKFKYSSNNLTRVFEHHVNETQMSRELS